jgi:hypothetical protein
MQITGNPLLAMHSITSLRTHRPRTRLGIVITVCSVLLGACAGSQQPRPVDPDITRARIAALIPAEVSNRNDWAVDIFAAFEALRIEPSDTNACAVIAVTAQESTFRVNPPVAGLPAIARKEIDARARRYRIPQPLVNAALALQSPTGVSYAQRLATVRTEQGLSDIFTDFTGMVPLGRQLFADLNPVRTGGPMQVSIDYAQTHAAQRQYPYPVPGSIRDEVFTRRGGMYFGIAHLLDYPVDYEDMLYRFADFNAGHYASRNAAFQRAVSTVSGVRLALDGDLLRHGSSASEPSNTELAVRKLAGRLELSDAQIRNDLERGSSEAFAETKLYSRVFKLAEKPTGRAVPRAVVPRIRLESPKITRQLTTEWFARRVKDRYMKCLARGSASRSNSNR